VCTLAALLLSRIPEVLASVLKYAQTGEAITAAFAALVLAGYALFQRSDRLATKRANAAEKRAAAVAEAAKEDRALLIDTNRKAGSSALWRAATNDGLRRIYTAYPEVRPLPATLFTATQLHDRILAHASYSAYAPLFLSNALDGVSLPTLDAARLEEFGVLAEHAPGLAAFLATLCENAEV
jgi:hypothetical protein